MSRARRHNISNFFFFSVRHIKPRKTKEKNYLLILLYLISFVGLLWLDSIRKIWLCRHKHISYVTAIAQHTHTHTFLTNMQSQSTSRSCSMHSFTCRCFVVVVVICLLFCCFCYFAHTIRFNHTISALYRLYRKSGNKVAKWQMCSPPGQFDTNETECPWILVLVRQNPPGFAAIRDKLCVYFIL